MEDDMENLMGGKKEIKCGVVLSVFQCQADRKRAAEEVCNVAFKHAF
jgi:hypothetical protein